MTNVPARPSQFRSAAFVLAATFLAATASVQSSAAELEGVEIPDTWKVGGTELVLNGIGSRDYTVFGIPVYVAGLYLEQKSSSPADIMSSEGAKVIHLVMLEDVGRDDAISAWKPAFDEACVVQDCSAKPLRSAIASFVQSSVDLEEGDSITYVFQGDRVTTEVSGHEAVSVQEPSFSLLLLSTFIGEAAVSDELKADLLGKAS